VFEFGENRVPVYPAAVAVFIAKFDFQTSVHLDCAIGSWVKLKYPAILYQVRFQSNPVYLIPTGTEFAGPISCRRYYVALAVDQILAVFRLNSLARLLCRILQDHFASGPLNN
jgi:hypothetical protein